MSVRISSTGPGPFFMTATTPVRPTPVVTVYPAFRASAAIAAADLASANGSSGAA